jgi:hypothetical protein
VADELPLCGQLRCSLQVRSLKFFHRLARVSSSAPRVALRSDDNRPLKARLRDGGRRELKPVTVGILRRSDASIAAPMAASKAASVRMK